MAEFPITKRIDTGQDDLLSALATRRTTSLISAFQQHFGRAKPSRTSSVSFGMWADVKSSYMRIETHEETNVRHTVGPSGDNQPSQKP